MYYFLNVKYNDIVFGRIRMKIDGVLLIKSSREIVYKCIIYNYENNEILKWNIKE